MSLFNNPFDGPMTRNNLIGLVLYIGLAIISIWATAESITSSFNFPPFISYLVATMIVFVLASMLSIFKESFENKSIIPLLFSILVFFLLWGISLATNSHKFFTQLKLEDIRKAEVERAMNELNSLKNGSEALGNSAIKDYEQAVTSRISSYYSEVANPEGTCGHGKVADGLKGKVEEAMPGSYFNLLTGYAQTKKGCRDLANDMKSQMIAELRNRTSSMRLSLDKINTCSDEEKRKKIEASLEDINVNYYNRSQEKIVEVLSSAHQFYNTLYDCVEFNLIQLPKSNTYNKMLPRTLEMPVQSKELEKISALIPYVETHPQHKPSFWLSIGIAFVIDLASFIIFYFMVMAPSNEW